MFLLIETIKSQTIMKLKPIKSPRIPPQSATRSANGNSISSFCTERMELVNMKERIVSFLVVISTGSSATYYIQLY